jgi:hypothetical protein
MLLKIETHREIEALSWHDGIVFRDQLNRRVVGLYRRREDRGGENKLQKN